MLRIDVQLTNEECMALEPLMQEISGRFTNRLMGAEHQPHDKNAIGWAAWNKFWLPVRNHLAFLQTPRKQP